jgi:hypothetical protein
MFPRALLTAIAGLIVCGGSFLGTLAVIDLVSSHLEPSPAAVAEGDRVEGLKTTLIYDEASLLRAAEVAKLQTSETLRGYIDGLERLPDGQVRLFGWAIDPSGDGSPIRILAFAKGKAVLEGETKGERPDVAAAYRLPPDQARNVSFELTAACNPRESLVVAAATKTNAIAPLRITTCP